jgi:hypothetical protein
MANCNKLFLDFDSELKVLSTKKDKLFQSAKNVRKVLRKHFKDHHADYIPKFAYQGSNELGTMIRTKEDTCDLDQGIYFFRKPDVEAKTLQKWIFDAVENITDTPAMHKNKCVRVLYAGDYHIDLPTYYKLKKDDDSDHPQLAIKVEGFKESDPLDFIKWFRNSSKHTPQLLRIIKDLKSWCDHVRDKMPSGLAMTILAEKYIQPNDRDDITLRDTLIKMDDELRIRWSCEMPSTPFDDLFKDFDDNRKRNFLDHLKSFIDDANKAIDKEKNQLAASKLWKKHLGFRFPEGADEDNESKEAALRAIKSSILGGVAKTNWSGKIQESSGVPHLKHSNYGGK